VDCRFFTGQKVVCTDAKPSDPNVIDDMGGLTEGAIYTISWLGPYDHACEAHNAITLHVAEVNRDPCPRCSAIVPFFAHRFKPLNERKTDISVFERLLTPKVKEIVYTD
jgi:hypothetical protein